MKMVYRNEDMSPRGKLTVLVQDDGDVIVCSQGMDRDLVQPGSSVEFCAIGSGGGRSPHTLRALYALVEAIERDNAEQPIAPPSTAIRTK
jgi:ATP-dependent protease HslVU (ClpYQ) peptidase subunit